MLLFLFHFIHSKLCVHEISVFFSFYFNTKVELFSAADERVSYLAY